MQSQNQTPMSLVHATLFVAIAILVIAAIGLQLGQTSYQLGQSTRNLVDSLEGTGGPVGWIQFAYNRLRPEFLLEPESQSEIPKGTDTVALEIRTETYQDAAEYCDLAPASILTCAVGLNFERLGVKELRHLANLAGVMQPASDSNQRVLIPDYPLCELPPQTVLACTLDLNHFTLGQLRSVGRAWQVKQYYRLPKVELVRRLSV